MKRIIFYPLCWVLIIFVVGCSSHKASKDELAFIDVSKEYAEKELKLTDLAEVTYVYLNSKSDDYVFKGGISYVTKNRIVVIDRASQSVLFFSKDGNPISRFNRKGQGPEEYTDIFSVMYDEEKDEAFVFPDFSDHIMVYSSSGEFKRKIALPQRNINGQVILFDDQSILVYDNTKLWNAVMQNSFADKDRSRNLICDSTFFLVSRMDGAVLDYIPLPNKNVDLSYKDLEGTFIFQVAYGRVRKCPEGLLLYNPEADTVFLYNKDKLLVPYFYKKPLVNDYNPKTAMDICMDAGRFQFISIYTYLTGKSPSPQYYMRDKKTGEIFRQKLTLSDYQGKDFCVNPRLSAYEERKCSFELNFDELEEAYYANKLSGKLKELVASLLKEENPNNVLMFVNFDR